MPRLRASRLPVPAGRIASGTGRVADRVDAALDHAVAAPHEQEVGAVVERLAARTSVRTCSSTPRTRSGRRRRRRPARDAAPTGHRRGSCPRARPPRPTVIRPPPRVGRPWAAARSTRRSCALSIPARTATYPTATQPAPSQGTGHDVGDVVHAAVHAGRGHDDRRDDGKGEEDAAPQGSPRERPHDDRERSVERDRSRGVAGGEAVGVDEVLESGHRGPVPAHEVGGDEVHARLDEHGHDEQRALRPTAVPREDDHCDARDREHGHGLGEVRADQREIVPRGRPPVGEPSGDVGVAVAEGVPHDEIRHQTRRARARTRQGRGSRGWQRLR